MGDVSGLVLAAGAGRRFGGPKALARLDGVGLVQLGVLGSGLRRLAHT